MCACGVVYFAEECLACINLMLLIFGLTSRRCFSFVQCVRLLVIVLFCG